MLRNVFLKTLRDQRYSLLFWGLGLVVLASYTVLFYPLVRDIPELDRMLEQAPEGMLEALTGGPLASFTTPEGYLNSQFFFVFIPLLFIVFAVGAGSGAVAGEEEKGTLEFLLSLPVPRRTVVVQKFAVMVVGLAALSLVLWATISIAAAIVDMDITPGRVLDAVLSSMMLGLVFGALALLLGCWRGRRGMAIGLAVALGVATYFLNSLGSLVEAIEDYRFLSPFYHNQQPNPLANGIDAGHMGVLMALAIIFFLWSLVLFERRDVGT